MYNNFKELEKQIMEQYNEPKKSVQNNIHSSLGIFQFIGNMTDLFFTKFIGAIIGSSPEELSPQNKKHVYPNTKD